MTKNPTANGPEEKGGYKINDPERLAQNFLRLLEESSNALTNYMERPDGQSGPYSAMSEFQQASKSLTTITQHWLNDPEKFSETQSALLRDYAELWSRSLKRVLGEEVEPLVEPNPGDSRFRDPDWTANPFFDFWKQAYLITSNWADQFVEKAEGVDEPTRRKAEFYLRQVESALSPSNFVLTNPQVMRETLATNGENLVHGMEQLAEDLKKSEGLFKISQTDLDAFEVGRNLAISPGKVVFQNEIMQLIQYSPTTESVHEKPLLIVPPWINKFYVLDLVPEKSLFKWAIDQGFTVFTISWVNPGPELAHTSFEDYMKDGILTAVGKVLKQTGQDTTNILGYCVGGTLLACTLAYMAATEDNRINSVTFLTTQVDFTDAGDLKFFVDDSQLKGLEQMMAERGYLDGSRMAAVFNMMRPQDLIWPYVVNNYLLGRKPFPFDLLYWNQDSTRMPAANHAFYLREFYNKNRLASGTLELCGVPIDLRKVKLPIYDLATVDDHIAPAKSVFNGVHLFGGRVKFVLAGSGHIAGVVNPPHKKKYQYWTNSKSAPTLELWKAAATEHAGSWWPDWQKWLSGKSGDMVPPRNPEKGKLTPLEDAPGSYVKFRV